jgi:hypothetical protein
MEKSVWDSGAMRFISLLFSFQLNSVESHKSL